MITYLPDGHEITVTETPGPVFKGVFASDPDGVYGYGASIDAAVESLALANEPALMASASRVSLPQFLAILFFANFMYFSREEVNKGCYFFGLKTKTG